MEGEEKVEEDKVEEEKDDVQEEEQHLFHGFQET